MSDYPDEGTFAGANWKERWITSSDSMLSTSRLEQLESENRRLRLAIGMHRERISFARQVDGEQGVAWMNEEAAREWRRSNRYLAEALDLFFDDETLDEEDDDEA